VPRRTNFRGRSLLFPLGAVLLAADLAALAAGSNRWLVFLAGVGALGLLDDALGAGGPRGWRGHGGALIRGELSTGAIKAGGTAGLAVYAALGTGATGIELAGTVAVLTLSAHAGNLLDTRPGRSEKALALVAVAVCVGSGDIEPLAPIGVPLAAAAACSWLTLRERAMLGDSGASMVGAMAGVLLATTLAPSGIYLVAGALVAISLYGEFRSIGAAVERVPLLQRLDSLGRAN
jgi:UDP-GlcNAc:undecaprenyl-phosphate/decaprenyl-phosphate GlcNAc-1-phosphate transferase